MIETRLECEHSLFWDSLHRAPAVGTAIYCQDCRDMSRVSSLPGYWYSKCGECAWHVSRRSLSAMRNQIQKHIHDRGHVVKLSNHDGTERYTVRTTHYAASVGTHSASVATIPRVLPKTGVESGPETLF